MLARQSMTIKELRQRHMKERGVMLERQLAEIEALREAQRNARVPVAELGAAVKKLIERDKAAIVHARRQGWVDPPDYMSWSGLAKAMWGDRPDHPNVGDASRMKRVLGLRPRTDGSVAKTIDYDMGAQIVEVAGLDPHSVGF